jgi:hypothetical protein
MVLADLKKLKRHQSGSIERPAHQVETPRSPAKGERTALVGKTGDTMLRGEVLRGF